MSVTTKVIGLASTAVIFAGMAFGQANLSCAPSSPNAISPQIPIELRSEGATELVSDELITCAAAPAGSTSGQVTATLSATGLQGVTSKVLSTSTGVTEATLQVTNGGITTYYQGTVSGTTITFGTAAAAVQFPTSPFSLQISNVRVNVTGQYPNNLQPVTEAVQLIAQGNGLAAVTNIAAQTVGNLRNSLIVTGSSSTGYVAPGGTSVAGTAATNNTYLVCSTSGANGSGASAFSLTIGETFAGAFKTKSQATFSVAGIPGSESGSFLGTGAGVGAGTGTANSGTRIKLIFAGIPTNATLNVPITVSNGNFTMVLTSGGETGAFALATSTVVGTSNTAIYEVVAADYTSVGSFTVTPWVTYVASPIASSIVIPAGPITVAVSYAPSPSTNGATLASPIPTIPYFANTSTTLTGASFSACQTTLLFPFVTNQQGFETGLVIANTGLDNLGNSKTPSVASGQSGACIINFYGSTGAEGGTQPTTVTTANFPSATNKPTTTIAPGTTHADILTNVAGGPFQGYAIAVCPFLYARGFAFIEDGLLTNTGVVEGYLADVISANRTALSSYGVQVGNNTPESSGQ